MSEGVGTRVVDQSESVLTVVVAGLVNLLIAVAKALAALITGSSALLSEAAHSLADTVTELLLFVSLRRGRRPADATHPLGYGREAYLWALLAALATFVAGAVVSIIDGVNRILHGGEHGHVLVAFVVLAVSFVLESVSLRRALFQVRGSARRWRISATTFLQETTDTTVRAVTFEDSAALIGLVLAAVGLGLTVMTGNPVWDGLSSVLIGLLLVVVAWWLARANLSLLVGRSAPLGLDEVLRNELESLRQVVAVPLFVTSVLGPRRLLVAAKVEFMDDCTTDDIERAADEAERRLRVVYPGVEYVFLDPTATRTAGKSDDAGGRPVTSDGGSAPSHPPQAARADG